MTLPPPGDYATRYHRTTPLTPRRIALVLVDLQRASASRDHGLGATLDRDGNAPQGAWRFDRIEHVLLPNAKRLLTLFRELQAPVFHIALGSRTADLSDVPAYLRPFVQGSDNRVGSPNHALLPEVAPLAGETVVTKSTSDAFIGTDLDARLEAAQVDTLVVGGVSTNSCVESTVRHAADLGYGVAIVADACAAASEQLHEAALHNLARLFADVVSTDEVITELRR